jgi:hypothetical protein
MFNFSFLSDSLQKLLNFPSKICLHIQLRNIAQVRIVATLILLVEVKVIPGRGDRIFPLVSVTRPGMGPTQPPVQWVQWVLSPGVKRGRGVTLTTHPI